MFQIFELAVLNGVKVMGVADTVVHTVRVLYIEAPSALRHEDVDRGPGKLTGREAIALGHILIELGKEVLGQRLRRDANLGER